MSETFSPAIEAFLAKLRETPRNWRLDDGCIRDPNGGIPLMSVGFLHDVWGDRKGADPGAVIRAGDNFGDEDLRIALLDACGLSEPQP